MYTFADSQGTANNAALQQMNLHLLESPGNPHIGGVLCTFPSGRLKALHWRSEHPIHDSMAMAKDLAARALDSCLQEGRADDAERTNWASVAAAMRQMVRLWNDRLEGARKPEVEAIKLPRGERLVLAAAGLASVGSLLAELAAEEVGGGVGEGPNSGEGGHPPGAGPHREPKSGS
jgi:hypothetical protein